MSEQRLRHEELRVEASPELDGRTSTGVRSTRPSEDDESDVLDTTTYHAYGNGIIYYL